MITSRRLREREGSAHAPPISTGSHHFTREQHQREVQELTQAYEIDRQQLLKRIEELEASIASTRGSEAEKARLLERIEELEASQASLSQRDEPIEVARTATNAGATQPDAKRNTRR